MILLGLEVHLVWSLLTVLSVTMVILGGMVNYFETFLPSALNEAFRYGKASRGRPSYWPLRLIQVRKKRFLHFYAFAIALATAVFVLELTVYVLEIPAPSWVVAFLDFCGTQNRTASSNAEAVVLATSLLLLQVWRRLYECAFVSVHSDSSTINLIHYASGFAHYFCACVGVLLEAPCFTSADAGSVGGHGAFRWVHVSLDPKSVTLTQFVAAAAFVWAWHHQRRAHQILARIRSDGGGGGSAVVYAIPRGDWFRWVSCPHYAAEVIMYACLAAVLGARNTTGLMLFVWVLVNQTVAALMSHFWYQDKFKDYPAERKAIFPKLL